MNRRKHSKKEKSDLSCNSMQGRSWPGCMHIWKNNEVVIKEVQKTEGYLILKDNEITCTDFEIVVRNIVMLYSGII